MQKNFVLFITGIVLLLTFTGCAKKEETYDAGTIVVGTVNVNEEMQKAALEFNGSQTEYKIAFKDYGTEKDPMTKIASDLMTGERLDIICLDCLPVKLYEEKGVLEDLTPYFDKDEELSTKDFIPAVYDTMCTEDGLYYVASGFCIRSLVGSKKIFSDKMGYTIDEFNEKIRNAAEDTRLFYVQSKASILYAIADYSIEDYVNWEIGKCSFDSESFKNTLDICNAKGTDKEEKQEDASDGFAALAASGKILCEETTVTLDNIKTYNEVFDGGVTYIGYPCEDRQGLYYDFNAMLGINAKSENKEGAWTFIRTFLKREYQYTNMYSELPTRQDNLDILIRRQTATQSYTDEFGNDYEPYDGGMVIDEIPFGEGPATEEEVELFYSLLNSTKKITNSDDKLMEIIQDDAKKYFEGKKSLDDTVDIIQNRCETYVNESR